MNAHIKRFNIEEWGRLFGTVFFSFVVGSVSLKAQTFSIYYIKGLSEQYEFIKPNDPYHGQVFTPIVKTGLGLQVQKERLIYEVAFVQNSIGVPSRLRYLNLTSTRREHWTIPENIMNSVNLGFGRKVVSTKHLSIDLISGLNLGYFNRDIRAFKNPQSPPPQRSESTFRYYDPADSSLVCSGFARGYFTSKANFSIPFKCAFNLNIWRLGVAIIPFFELGLNNYYKMTHSYYLPTRKHNGYMVTKLNGTNYGLNFRITYKLFELEVLKPKIKNLLN